MWISNGRYLSIDSQSGGILEIARDSVPGGHGKDEVVLAKGLETRRGIHAPTKNRICPSIREESGDGAEQACDLDMAALEFLSKANRTVWAWSIWLSRKFGRLEGNIGARLFHRDIQCRALTQGKSIA